MPKDGLFYLATRFTILTVAHPFALTLNCYQHSASDICLFSNPSCHAWFGHGMTTCLCLSGVLGSPLEPCLFVQARRLKLWGKSIIDVICTEAEVCFGFERCLLGLLRGSEICVSRLVKLATCLLLCCCHSTQVAVALTEGPQSNTYQVLKNLTASAFMYRRDDALGSWCM